MAVIDGMNINGNAYDLRDKVAVRFDEAQSLTDAQKNLAKANIGAADAGDLQDAVDNSVHVNEAQTLTEEQKATGRGNIDAPSVAAMNRGLNEKVSVNQGVAQAGKMMIVGLDGNVTTGNAPSGISDEVKTTLLDCFLHVAWTDEHGQDYYNALRDALYSIGYPRITAEYNQGNHIIYDDHSIESLRNRMVVKYFADKDSTGEVVTDYELSGTFVENETCSITVTYNSLQTMVDVVVAPYNYRDLQVIKGSRDNANNQVSYVGDSTLRVATIPFGIRLPYGKKFIIDFGTLKGGNYYNATLGVKYDDELYDVDWTITPGVTRQVINSSSTPLTFDWNAIGYNGWTNNNIEFTAKQKTYLVFNIKKGTAGSSTLTDSDIELLNNNIRIREVEE